MTSYKLLKILGAVFLVLIVLWLVYLFQLIPHRKAPYLKAAATADAVYLRRADRGVSLRKVGKDWTVSADSGTTHPADAEKVKILLDGLKEAQLDEVISDRSDRAGAFEVSPESGTRVTLSASARVQADGIFGKQAPDYTHVYFKFPGTAQVYLARGPSASELGGLDGERWRDHQLITIADTQVQGIVIETAEPKIDLERSSDTWTMNGRPIDPAPVYGLVGTLAHLKADDFIAGSSTPVITAAQLTYATVTVKGGSQTAVLHLGPEDKTTKRFPAAVSSDTLVWLSEYKVQSFLPKASTFRPKK